MEVYRCYTLIQLVDVASLLNWETLCSVTFWCFFYFLTLKFNKVFLCPYIMYTYESLRKLWLYTLEYYTLCWNTEPQRWCDFIVPTFNTSLWTTPGLWKKFIWRTLLFACYPNCWKLVLPVNHWCTKLKGRNKTITWQSETDSLFTVTQLISFCTI